MSFWHQHHEPNSAHLVAIADNCKGGEDAPIGWNLVCRIPAPIYASDFSQTRHTGEFVKVVTWVDSVVHLIQDGRGESDAFFCQADILASIDEAKRMLRHT